MLLLQGSGRAAKQYAAKVLARLADGHETTQAAIAEAGAIAPLVALLDGMEGAEAQQESAGALFALADHERNREAITSSDGIGPLVEVSVQPSRSSNPMPIPLARGEPMCAY